MMLKLFVIALVVLAVSAQPLDHDLDEDWVLFKRQYSKLYTAGAETRRRAIWEEQVQEIAKHNREYDMGIHTYTVGLNEYSDLTDEEFNQMRGAIYTNISYSDITEYFPSIGVTLPATVDWRKEGLVTGVKNQLNCGSCWSFGATGTLEGQHAKATGKLISLSEQNLVDCSTIDHGCDGGWPANTLRFIQAQGGINSEEAYPYTATDNGHCMFDPKNVVAKVTGVKLVPKGEHALQTAVAEIGPIAVAINTKGNGFRSYKSGVYVDNSCSPYPVDHAVLAVGYGTDADQDYWLVKNSWGASWGEGGYIKMARNNNNQCGIALFGCFPTV